MATAFLLALLATIAPQEAPARTLEALKREYAAIRLELDSPATFERARRALHDFVARLIEDPDVDPGLVYHRAKELATDPVLTPEALERARYFRIAAGAAERSSLPNAVLGMHEQRAVVHAGLGDMGLACDLLEAALEACPGATLQRPHTLVTLADLLRKEGRFGAALERASEVGELTGESASLVRARAKATLARSAVLRDVGSPEVAEPELRELAAGLEAGYEQNEVEPERVLAVWIELLGVDIAMGDTERLRRDAERFLASPILAGRDAQRAQVLLHLGAARVEQERQRREAGEDPPREARRDFEEALQLGLDPAGQLFVRTRLVAEALESGDLEQAQEQLEAMRLVEPAATPLTTRIEGLVVEARVALARSASRPELAASRDAARNGWGELVRAWGATPRPAGGLAFLKYPHRRSLPSVLIQLELALAPGEAGVTAAFEHLLAAQELFTLGAPFPDNEVVDLARVRARLLAGEDHGLLVYLSAQDRSHVFAIDHDSITHHDLPRSETLEEARTDYVSWLLLRGVHEMPPERQAELAGVERERALRLAAVLLPPELLERIRPWRRLSISGIDTLGPVPFEWLPAHRGQRLGLEVALDFVPSIPHATRVASANPRGAPRTDLILVSDAIPGASVRERWPGLGRVTPGESLGVRLSWIYGADRWRSLEGPAASPSAIARLDLGAVATLQFLVHAVEEPGAAVPVALVLSPDEGPEGGDGLFRAQDVGELRGAPRLVVLTACGSGQGPLRRGDALVASPVGTWLAHGSRAVVASRHQLTLDEARRTTNVLHAALGEGTSPAEAMRRARRELFAAEPDLAPFLGGLLQVFGLGHEPLFAPSAGAPRPSWTIGMVVGLAAVACLGAALRARR